VSNMFLYESVDSRAVLREIVYYHIAASGWIITGNIEYST